LTSCHTVTRNGIVYAVLNHNAMPCEREKHRRMPRPSVVVVLP
jgi:hypothetical protein